MVFKVQITVCTNRGMSAQFVTCLLGAHSTPDIEISVAFGIESLIDRARAVMATRFLKTDNSVMIFIDDDIVNWSMDDISQIVSDVQEKQSIVGGSYSIKNAEGPRLCAVGIDPGDHIARDIGPQDGLVEVRWTATGFMAVPRKVLEDVAATLPLVSGYGKQTLYPMFQPFVHEGVYLSEDYSFCQRARDLNHKIWLDPRIILGHVGNFVYNLS